MAELVWSNVVQVTVGFKIAVKSLSLTAERAEGYVGEPIGFRVDVYLEAPAPYDLTVPVDVYVNDSKTLAVKVPVRAGSTAGRATFTLTFKAPGTYKVQCSAPKVLG